MLTTNADISDRLINGQLGYTYILQQIDTVTQICIKFDDNAKCLKAIQNESLAKTHNAAQYIYKSHTSTIKPTQFHIMLAYACTMHKVQGLTLNIIYVSRDLNKQKNIW